MHHYCCNMGFGRQCDLHMPWRMNTQRRVVRVKSMAKMTILSAIDVNVHRLHSELVVTFMRATLLHYVHTTKTSILFGLGGLCQIQTQILTCQTQSKSNSS